MPLCLRTFTVLTSDFRKRVVTIIKFWEKSIDKYLRECRVGPWIGRGLAMLFIYQQPPPSILPIRDQQIREAVYLVAQSIQYSRRLGPFIFHSVWFDDPSKSTRLWIRSIVSYASPPYWCFSSSPRSLVFASLCKWTLLLSTAPNYPVREQHDRTMMWERLVDR